MFQDQLDDVPHTRHGTSRKQPKVYNNTQRQYPDYPDPDRPGKDNYREAPVSGAKPDSRFDYEHQTGNRKRREEGGHERAIFKPDRDSRERPRHRDLEGVSEHPLGARNPDTGKRDRLGQLDRKNELREVDGLPWLRQEVSYSNNSHGKPTSHGLVARRDDLQRERESEQARRGTEVDVFNKVRDRSRDERRRKERRPRPRSPSPSPSSSDAEYDSKGRRVIKRKPRARRQTPSPPPRRGNRRRSPSRSPSPGGYGGGKSGGGGGYGGGDYGGGDRRDGSYDTASYPGGFMEPTYVIRKPRR